MHDDHPPVPEAPQDPPPPATHHASPAEPDPGTPTLPPTPAGWTRRRFLRVGLGTALVAAVGGIVSETGRYPLDPELVRRLQVLTAKEYTVLTAAVERLIAGSDDQRPGASELGLPLWIDRFLSAAHPDDRRDVKALLALFEHGPPLFEAMPARFTELGPDEQDRYLTGWAGSGLALRRQGFAALKGLAMLSWYAQAQSWPAIGYGGPVITDSWPPRKPPPVPVVRAHDR